MTFWWQQEFQSTREAKRRFLLAYTIMLDFFGIKLLDKNGNVSRAPNWQDRFQHLNEWVISYIRFLSSDLYVLILHQLSWQTGNLISKSPAIFRKLHIPSVVSYPCTTDSHSWPLVNRHLMQRPEKWVRCIEDAI